MRIYLMATLYVISLCLQAPAQDRIQKDSNYLYLCSFNIYLFGVLSEKYQSLDENFEGSTSVGIPQRIKNLSNVLSVGNFDLIVIQELQDGEAGGWALEDLKTQLNSQLNQNYKAFQSQGIGKGFRMNESIGFIYDPDVVNPEIISGTTSLSKVIEVDGREVYQRDFIHTQWKASNFDFSLISAHLLWSKKGIGGLSDRERGYLKVEEILVTPTPSQYSQDPDIIIVGDFNRFGGGLSSVEKITYDLNKWLAPNVTFFDPAFNSLKKVSSASINGKNVPDNNPQFVSTTVALGKDVYDIIFMTKDADEEYSGSASSQFGTDFGILCFDEPGAFGFQSGSDTLNTTALKEAYSDHRPLWARFAINDPSSSDSSVAITYLSTPNGKKFHLSGCRYIRNSTNVITWTDRTKVLETRAPCKVCEP